MRHLFRLTVLLVALAVPFAVEARGCYSMAVSDVNPDYPNCIRHITTTCCEGNCTVVTTYECY